ncbi:peptidase [Pleurocapsa sp. CCALA 161]|uniref:PepSY-associated TM helix domain-containing protein n=1 Tax=Pleurocapsa sp. CCALA 161 TaxID=2107688 RepID=UPI000D066441|nr:PepSY-associated TM helix domain-containing protein [Pleurocapsa sp. CCALA 161]PSB09683.1 peptidase [Pleurocapsa sp. CCALA 161]
MNAKKLRNLAFSLHRWLGLTVGIIAIVIGITGSILVFYQEIDPWLLSQRVGQIEPTGDRLSLEVILDKVQANYQERQDLKFDSISPLEKPDLVQVSFIDSKELSTEVDVSPYTGEVLNTRVWDTSFFGRVFQLHYALLAGNVGTAIAGIAALFMFILSLTGLVLWSGWRNFMAGFKIKWNARLKRKNYDIHQVAGIISVVFLAMIALTGFFWNFHDQTEPLIYAATFSPKPVEPVSQVVPGTTTMNLEEILQRAQTALPGGKITYIGLPTEPTEVFHIYKQLPGQKDKYTSEVALDRYTGKVLKTVNATQALPLGDRVLNAFVPMHYGTFGGLPTRILYIFVGLSPTILFITGLVMYRLRRRPQPVAEAKKALVER